MPDLADLPLAEGRITERLNAAQRQVADHGDSPLLVSAGPGAGKTGTLAARVATLLARGADPQRVLLLTFSRRAAREMSRRAAQSLQRASNRPLAHHAPSQPALPWAGTFHAVAARWLRRWARPLGLDPQFGVLDRGDAEDLLALERESLGLAGTRERFPRAATCAAILSRVVSREEPLEAVLAQAFPWCARWEAPLRQLFDAYAGAKLRQRLLDFDDLLVYWSEALADPAIAGRAEAGFDHVLVDEAQDLNALQWRLVQRLSPGGRGLTVVGDDDQAIYGFRGGDPGPLQHWPPAWAPGAHRAVLAQNYRATPQLLGLANALMAEAAPRQPKVLWTARPDGPRPRVVTVADEAAQADWVIDEVLRGREEGLQLRQQAVLFRAGSHSTALELALIRRQVPFVKFGGLQFMGSQHVRDLFALLRWAANPAHRAAGLRCAMLVDGIGPARARALADAVAASADPAAVIAAYPVPAASAADWATLRDTWLALHRAECRWPEDLDRAVAWLQPRLARRHDDVAARAADLAQLQQIGRGWPSRERFVTELTIDPPQASGKPAGDPHRDEDYLILSTVHAAKGQEWSAVQVLNVVDGCMPADLATGDEQDIAEERRLLYVAATRARVRLNLLVPQRFFVTQQARLGDRHLYAPPSRFLTPAVLACCDRVAGEVEAAEPPAPASSAPRAEPVARMATTATTAVPSLSERVRSRWSA